MAKKQKKPYEKMLEIVQYCISKDETRPNLAGYIHLSERKALISTDGHILAHAQCLYDQSLADLIINPKTLCTVKREYPRVASIIPTSYKLKISYRIEPHHYQPHRSSQKPPRAYFYESGKVSNEYLPHENLMFRINASFLKPLADGTEYVVKLNGSLSPITFEVLEADNFMIIMPLKSGKDDADFGVTFDKADLVSANRG